MTLQNIDPKIVELFEAIRKIYGNHGFDLFHPWQDWPSLNKYYGSPISLGDGWFVVTNEDNYFNQFACLDGSHPVFGSHISGDNDAAFKELSEVFKLELVLDEDNFNFMTYQGCRIRYWKIGKN